ncbi:MAG: T9SS C-terminal target domain-containing protein [Chitinophagaceae bacterium]|nr:MAG: T9SS C-terminal target domain-containing protein [Chitinophagaceae bacterium]
MQYNTNIIMLNLIITTMKHLTLTTLILSLCIVAYAQTPQCYNIEYDYDNAGNRIVRKNVDNCPPGATLRLQEEEHSTKEVVTKPDTPEMQTEEAVFALTVYPNPTSGKLIVAFDDVIVDAGIVLYDVNGMEVFRKQSFSGTQTSVDMSGLSSGMYFISVVTAEGIVNKAVVRQ